MATATAERRRKPVGVAVTVYAMALALALATAAHHGRAFAPVTLGVCVLVLAHERILAWRSLVSLIVLTILFIPIKRYTLPSGLPFNLELYRIVVATVFILWFASLLVDPKVRLRASGLELPIICYVLACAFSIFANMDRVTPLGTYELKTVTFFLSFILVYYMVIGLVQNPRDVDFLVRILAGGGAILGFFGVIESTTHHNVFNHLQTVLPILHLNTEALPDLSRGGEARVYGTAQHPIAYGAALAMLLPLAIYRAQAFRQKRWWVAATLMLLGVMASRSRTGLIMLVVIAIVYVIFRPHQMKRAWPALIPALAVIHFAVPGAIGTAYGSFFKTNIVQEQHYQVGSGRLSTLWPALRTEFEPNPILGEGFGTRITTDEPGLPPQNAPILDDGWLGILLETGVVGALSLLWIYVRSIRLMGRAAWRDLGPRGSLLIAAIGAVASYGVGMFTYDAPGFIQVTFLWYILLGVGMAAMLAPKEEWERFAARSAGRAYARSTDLAAATSP